MSLTSSSVGLALIMSIMGAPMALQHSEPTASVSPHSSVTVQKHGDAASALLAANGAVSGKVLTMTFLAETLAASFSQGGSLTFDLDLSGITCGTASPSEIIHLDAPDTIPGG